jgi:hypothetical protein
MKHTRTRTARPGRIAQFVTSVAEVALSRIDTLEG